MNPFDINTPTELLACVIGMLIGWFGPNLLLKYLPRWLAITIIVTWVLLFAIFIYFYLIRGVT